MINTIEQLWRDLRFSYFQLKKSPGFTIIVVLTLTLGIGANTTVFSWINSTLLDPIPGIARTSEIVAFVRGETGENSTPPMSYLDYLDLRERNRNFSGLMAYHHDWMALTGVGKPVRIYGVTATANYFEVLGVKPSLGRGFQDLEDKPIGGAPVVVISDNLWRTHFFGDRTVLGRKVEINRHPYTIIGIAPPAFQGVAAGLRAEVWIPLSMAETVWGYGLLRSRGDLWLNVFGRLRSGVPREQAQQEMNLLMQQIVQRFPESHQDSHKITLAPLWRSPMGANLFFAAYLPMLMAISAIVLLLACANVANLLLVRLVGRRRELAIRLSMGANRWQLVRQLLVESVLLSLLGGCAAWWLTAYTASLLPYFIPHTSIPFSLSVQTDWRVMSATFLIALLAGVIFGIVPALRSSRLSPAAILKEEGGNIGGGLHKSRLASMLVVAQISLAMLLLVCAGLFIRSLQQTARSHPGFDAQNVMLFSYDLAPSGLSNAAGMEFHRQLLDKIKTLPGVESTTLADAVPLSFSDHTNMVIPEGYIGQPHESMEMGRVYAGPNYFHTLNISLMRGRDFSPQDNLQSREVAIVSQGLAERYWPGQEALGKRVHVEGRWWTVIGVARNVKWRNASESAPPFVYLPLLQDYYPEVTLHVRVKGDPWAFSSEIEKALHEMNPELPLFEVTTLEKRTQVVGFLGRLAAALVGTFGFLALLLAFIGIYGVVAYATRQRTHEIGIRRALGAQTGAIIRLVLRHGLILILAGLMLGWGVSLSLTRLLRSQLFGIAPSDWLTFGCVAVVLCLIGLLACFLPARHAAQVEPMVALRQE